ncbi:kinesin-like protein KIF28P [Aplysia californica]|uniref:Kinesin-like protein KIF28P n=1 Tax=Aplysia californica TaxID=6500 RepID=A0ABM0ZY09_APLCA|nr:kinesin-like protein KIF28P [Aplysia californica]
MPEDSVKVAVRVRPFNQREMDRQAKLIIKMQGSMTSIQNPETPKDEPKKFSFDYSYWSHDGFVTQDDGFLEATPGSQYASQKKVFADLGQGVLDNAFEGYNCSLFAYGQTGSGKSYSTFGYGSNKGIVPTTCDELFKAIDGNKDDNKRFEVTLSILEIYNEQVRDLLSKDNPKGGLQVRQNPSLGMFYVQDLKKVPVGSYAEIVKRMDQGTSNRTVASTNMNATSSRAHTLVTIVFDQIIRNNAGQETKKTSIMNLVDLAGSERADSTGATGDRLKEGANINRSLSALGNVISALAEQSMGKKTMVKYRDSVLTKLLQNALGGNSKTLMIAALSPADINYDETLSTLRYADRAKKIKNQAVINENPMDKMIRELKEENDKLRKALEAGGTIPMDGMGQLSPEEVDKMRRQMEEEIRAQLVTNQQMLSDSEQTWDEKLSAARHETEAFAKEESREMSKKNVDPHLMNLNEDPMLSGVVFHFLSEQTTVIGRKDGNPDVVLNGLSIQKKHAVFTNEGGEVSVKPGSDGAKIRVNGVPITGSRVLEHMDRVIFGSNHVYVFVNPTKPNAPEGTPKEITWEHAQKEVAQAKGFATGLSGLTKEQQIVQEQILEILPMVSEVNAVSEELNKHKSFEVVLISAAAQEQAEGKSETGSQEDSLYNAKVMVKMKNLLNGNTWLWERGKFMNRRYLIQEMYQRYLDGEDVLSIAKEQDPFWEPTEDVLIGTANVFLQSLAYALDFADELSITDYKGQEEGKLMVNITPCTQAGMALDEDNFVEDPKDLVGKPFHFKIGVRSAEIHKARFSKGVRVKYRLLSDKDFTETKLVTGSLSPDFAHSRIVSISKLKQEHLDFFEGNSITFLVYGKQEDSLGDPKLSKLTTKELRQMEQIGSSDEHGRRKSVFAAEPQTHDHSHLKTELVLMQRKYERLAQKERRMMQLCDEWGKKPPEEQQFDPFFRAVSAVAHSTGTRLKTRVQLLNQVLALQKQREMESSASNSNENDEDTVSLFVFGEEEEDLAKEADKANGVIEYNKVKNHHFPIEKSSVHFNHDGRAANGGHKQAVKGSNGKEKSGSSACTIM